MDKTLIKNNKNTPKTPKTYTKTFFTNCILRNSSVETVFHTTVKNLRGLSKLFIKLQIWLVWSLGFKVQSLLLSTINSNPPFAYVILLIWYSPLPFWIGSFATVSLYCFTSEIQELMLLSQTLTTSWHLIQFPVVYLRRPIC